MRKFFLAFVAISLSFAASGNSLQAALIVTEQTTGNVLAFDETTFAWTTFAQIDTLSRDTFLSGVAFGNNRVYVTELSRFGAVAGRLHSFNLSGGDQQTTDFDQLFQPGGIAVNSNGNIYVSNIFGGEVPGAGGFVADSLRIFSPTMAPVRQINDPTLGSTTGIGFVGSNTVIAGLFSGVFQFDGTTVSEFNPDPANIFAAGQVAVDSGGNVYVGHGLGQSSSVFKFDPTGATGGPLLSISDASLNGTGQTGVGPGTVPAPGTSPSGVVVDADGNLIVAVLGRTTPANPGGERGGLFKYTADGTFIRQILPGPGGASAAFSSVTIAPVAVPEPSVLSLLAIGGFAAATRLRRKIISRK